MLTLKLYAAFMLLLTLLFGHELAAQQVVIERSLPAELSERYEPLLSANFIVYHSGNRAHAERRAALLEQARSHFYEAFDQIGYPLTVSPTPLPCLVFADRAELLSYAREADRVDMSWSGGYYSARTNRIALFEEKHVEESRAASSAKSTAGGTLVMASASDEAPARLHRPPALNMAKTAHEAAHQLAFNSGLQQRGVMYPLWASEGLATNFEPVGFPDADGRYRAFGPSHDNVGRRLELVSAAQRDRLMPLEQFLTTTRIPAHDPEALIDLYAQAWGLFNFLYHERPTELRRYYAALAALEPGMRDARTLRREITDAFGPIAQLERDWDRFVAALPR